MMNDKDNYILIGFRIIGTQDCENCQKLIMIMDSYKMSYEFMDANSEKNEKFCDKYDIDRLPVLQAYNMITKNVIMSKIYDDSMVPIDFFRESIDKVSRDNSGYRYADNFQPNGIRINPYDSKKDVKKKRGCSDCGK